MIIANAKAVLPDEVKKCCVRISGGKITEIAENIRGDGEIYDAEGMYLVPGFVDIHVHGGGGFSAMSGDPADIVAMADAHARFGTTSIVPTTLTAPVPALKKAMDSVKKAMRADCRAHILGVHLEGPYISPKKKGAQSEKDILVPVRDDPAELLDYTDIIRIMGAAPETEGGMELGKEIAARGITASVAHSDADYATACRAFENGYSDVTHIYNGCTSLHKEGIFRVAGVAEAGLVSDCTVQFIGDLRHIPEGVVKIIYACKGADNAAAITDGLDYSACDMAEGTRFTQENGQEAVICNGVMCLGDMSCLAGSVTTMGQVFRNLRSIGIPLCDCVKMCSSTPARVAGFGDSKGRIAAGYDADLLVLDEKLGLVKTFLSGKND